MLWREEKRHRFDEMAEEADSGTGSSMRAVSSHRPGSKLSCPPVS